METLALIILASLIISLISFSGSILFIFKEAKIRKYMIIFVAIAAGTMLGTTFTELIPESFELFEELTPSDDGHGHGGLLSPGLFILLGILAFYFIEKYIHWHHHHEIGCHKHSLSTLAIVGDGFHNLIDGILIGITFMVDVRVGIFTTLAIALHEIPQEIGDLSILLHSGMSKYKALFWNFASALVSVFGAVFAYFFLSGSQYVLPFLIAFTAGSFIYISLTDIVPEINKKDHPVSQNIITFFFIFGIGLTILLGQFLIH